MADGRHIVNGKIVICQQKSSEFDENWYTHGDLELGDSQMTKY